MIKTIKVKKTKNLSELIAYISVSGIKDANFVSNYENVVSADHSGQITTAGKFYNDTFKIEVEEVITDDTYFENLVELEKDGQLNLWFDMTLGASKSDGRSEKVYALIDNNLQLIWEAE